MLGRGVHVFVVVFDPGSADMSCLVLREPAPLSVGRAAGPITKAAHSADPPCGA